MAAGSEIQQKRRKQSCIKCSDWQYDPQICLLSVWDQRATAEQGSNLGSAERALPNMHGDDSGSGVKEMLSQ